MKNNEMFACFLNINIISYYKKSQQKRRDKKMENKVLIFGHKNPDTDTICSAMVKEILNKKNGCEK